MNWIMRPKKDGKYDMALALPQDGHKLVGTLQRSLAHMMDVYDDIPMHGDVLAGTQSPVGRYAALYPPEQDFFFVEGAKRPDQVVKAVAQALKLAK